ncbi:hypothetical protein HMPREF3223_01705 [Cutibacterium avidum]|nr:hypothetical protein HMPREF3223_01705 [Cutibacterium avidum]
MSIANSAALATMRQRNLATMAAWSLQRHHQRRRRPRRNPGPSLSS